jgi:hypothetical protein
MQYKIENISTETWHRIMDDLKDSGFSAVYEYDGMDAGIDYNRCDLLSGDGGELIVFEWDNWSEGEVKAGMARLEELRDKYRLSEPVEI